MITISDIASRAGVSRTTVSYVLNGRESGVRISEETRQRVSAAAAELGYRRNALAHAVTTGRNPVLGFLACAPEGELVARLLAGALDEAEESGYFIKVLRLRHNTVNAEVIERCAELRLAGVIVLYLDTEQLKYLHGEMARYGIPVAVLDDSFPQERGVRVVSDDIDGCRQAIAHLVALGHTKIACISGPQASGCASLREEGYRLAMREHGLQAPESYLQRGDWDEDVTEAATRALLSSEHGRPSAIVCAGDEWAMVAARTLRRCGLRVPEDVSVIGFGDIRTARLWEPPLTTVAQPFQEMGRLAVKRLIAQAEAPDSSTISRSTPIEEALPTQLVVRQSTARVAPSLG
jgi:DNA-binding LacI/PurR family transcriptional regulator